MNYLDGPSSFFMDLSRIFEQLKRDQLSSLNPAQFYYYVRPPKEARQQEIPTSSDKQIALIKQLAAQSGYEVSEPESDQQQNKRLLISIKDTDRFAAEYNKFAGRPIDIMNSVKAKQAPPDEGRVTVEPKSYDAANGILTVAGKQVYILKQQNRRGKLGETKEARLMRLLFDSVNRLEQGIPMRQVISVTGTDFDANKRKQVKGYVAEINKKVKAVAGIDELIISNQNAVMVDKRYL